MGLSSSFSSQKEAEMNDILTKSQELRKYGKTLKVLEKLIAAPESQDLINNIRLGYFQLDLGCDSLYLTTAGLKENTLRKGSVFVQPSIELVKRYNLTHKDLLDLLARLKQ